ncbi:MAG: M20/M25/M40 family metallo-hydrolase [Hyphomonas sp.]|tara:strand:+ start:1725 stop:3107 length:1383 start_codon:yes stop_codon:yes gene_type:complete
MNKKLLTSIAALWVVGCISAPVKTEAEQADVDKAVEILGRSVAFDTVEGRGQVPAYAAYLARELIAGGFAEDDVATEPFGETATLMAYYAGRSGATPIVLNAHMDVVEADPADWVRDPFRMETDGTYFYGRGVLDNKYGLTMLVTTLMRLKREGFVPEHDIILVLTGDEETAQVTAAEIAPRFQSARMVLNADAGGGTLGEDGKPLYYSLQAGEKTYADFEVVFTNPGGHSSRPAGSNAIVDMSAALTRVAAYAFPPQTSELTQAYFRETAKQTPGALGEAMARFAENPDDAEAVTLLSAEPEYIGQVRTTCVATQIEGGHAQNALPQHVAANINCRIFPGVAPRTVQAKLQELVGDAGQVNFPLEFPQSETSPLDAELMAAVRKALDTQAPGLPIIPSMSAGTTDSLLFRGQGIPSYGVSGLFMKPSDDYAHGLNERVPVDAIPGSLEYWHVLLTELAG